MPTLDAILSGRQQRPRRIVLYGTHGIGKSTFAAMAERPIFLPTEDGLADIDCKSFPLAASFDAVMESIAALYTGAHDFATAVVDSLDWLERLIHAAVCRDRGISSIEDIGYAKGYKFALPRWGEFLAGLDALRLHRGMSSILIAHAKVERFENPETDSYDRYAPRLDKHASHIVQEWADEVLFATYKVYTAKNDKGFNRTETKGIGQGERVIYTTERPAYIAKNRLSLPNELPLDWREYAKHLNPQPAIAA